METKYVLGFAFVEDGSRIVMIRKTRPIWQAGKLNGLGGKIEPQDVTSAHAMARECFEECGVETQPDDWHRFAKLNSTDWTADVFRIFDDKFKEARTMEDQEIIMLDVKDPVIQTESMHNIDWLTVIALDKLQPTFFVEVTYESEA